MGFEGIYMGMGFEGIEGIYMGMGFERINGIDGCFWVFE